MSVNTMDKIYLFTLTNEECWSAVDAWFKEMSTPTEDELKSNEELEAFLIKRDQMPHDEKNSTFEEYWRLSRKAFVGGKDERGRFNVTITSHFGDRHRKDYWTATLFTNYNHRMTDHLSRTLRIFTAKYPNVGVEHYSSVVEWDEEYYVLGCEAGWGRHKEGNAVAWFFKHVMPSEEGLP